MALSGFEWKAMIKECRVKNRNFKQNILHIILK